MSGERPAHSMQAIADVVMDHARRHWSEAADSMRSQGIDDDVIEEACRMGISRTADAVLTLGANFDRLVNDSSFDFAAAVDALTDRLDRDTQ